MAIYHHSIKIISRGKGKSAVVAAAYRLGETITNEYDGITHDYTRKGGIAHTEIILPENAPSEYLDRATLWNAVEKSERYKTAQLAREIEIALPGEIENGVSNRRKWRTHTAEKREIQNICLTNSDNGIIIIIGINGGVL
jgi:hypothetical protein